MSTKIEELTTLLIGIQGALLGMKVALLHGGWVYPEQIDELRQDIEKITEKVQEMVSDG